MLLALRKLITSMVTAAIMALPLSLAAQKPAIPKATYTWGLEDGNGIVNCSVTAPTNYYGALFYDGDPLEAGTTLKLTVVRSCAALNESRIEVFTVGGLSPGQTVNRVDNAQPAWQYGFEYSYTAFVTIEKTDGETSIETTSSLKPGYSFPQLYIDSMTASDDLSSLSITAVVPTDYKDVNGNLVKLTENYFTAFSLYRQDAPPTPADTPVATFENPKTGQEFTFNTSDFVLNEDNKFFVMAVGPYGNSVSIGRRIYIGYDTPGPVAVTARQNRRNVDIEWTAPTMGNSNGSMGPYPITYNVYRSWGYGEDNRKLLVENTSELSFTDDGADLETAMMVNYLVVPVSEVGVGNELSFANGTNYSHAPFMVGPDVPLPFVDKFTGGGSYGLDPQQLWLLGGTKPDWYFGRPAKTGSGYYDPTVQPLIKNENIAYALFTERTTDKEATMASWYIDIKTVAHPELKFYYYAIAGTDACLDVEMSDGASEYTSIKKINISDDTDLSTYDITDIEKNWRQATVDLTPYRLLDGFRLRFRASYTSKPGSVMVSHIELDNNESLSICTPADGSMEADGSQLFDAYTPAGLKVASGITSDEINRLPAGIYIFRTPTSAKKMIVK